MLAIETERFGKIEYEENSSIRFPRGLPGFEEQRRFVAVRLPGCEPLMFLQSLDDQALCFLTAPMSAVAPEYRLEVSPEDLAMAGLRPEEAVVAGSEVLCLAVISLRESGPTANLLAPIVMNLRDRMAVQAVSLRQDDPLRHSLMAPEEAAVCS